MQQLHAPRFRSSPDGWQADRVTRVPRGPIEVGSAPFVPMPMSHSAVRRISARARHDAADQCRVSNCRAFSKRLPLSPGWDQNRAIATMQ
jgi:hypothetical protein